MPLIIKSVPNPQFLLFLFLAILYSPVMVVITLDKIIEYCLRAAKLPLSLISNRYYVSSAKQVNTVNPAPTWPHLVPLYTAQLALSDVPCMPSCSSNNTNNAPVPDRGSGELVVSMDQNKFNRELAKWDLVETVDITADGTDSDVSEQGGDGYMDNAKRQPLKAIGMLSPIIILGRSVQVEKRALTWWS
jgi:hypothetical protein